MINRKVEKPEWKQFFDFLSKQAEGTRAEIEVASLKLGDQIEAAWLPVIGLVYDHKDNFVEIALEASKRDIVDHIIQEPREIYFAEEGRQFMGLDVIDSEGAHHIVKLKDSLMLPMESKGRAKVRDAVRKRMGKPPKEEEARPRASRPRPSGRRTAR